MKKILLVAANGFSKSGVPTVFMNIVRNLSKEGYSFDIIYFSDKDDYYKSEFLSYGGRVFLFNKQHRINLFNRLQRYLSGHKYYVKTLKLIKNNGPYDTIHSFAEYLGCHFFKAAYKMNVKQRIYHVNNCVVPGGNIINRLMAKHEKKLSFKYANKFIGCSSLACEITLGGKIPYEVINNPFDNAKFFFSTNYRQPDDCIKMVQTGFFAPIKNQLFSLLILKELNKMGRNAVLHLVGFEEEQGYLEFLRDTAKELYIDGCVFFHEKDADLPKLYSECDCMLLPSTSEAFGIVLIEAQATGMTCFVSSVVPQESNVGGCTYLDLNSGAKIWAETIADWFFSTNGKKTKYDCSKFFSTNIINKYIMLYNFQMGRDDAEHN